MESISQLPDELSVRAACDALGLNRATYYRDMTASTEDPHHEVSVPSPSETPHHRPDPPRKLSPKERETLIELLHSERFADQPPREIYATLLSQGRYICSVRTMYRVLKNLDATKERRRQRAHLTYEAPFVRASEPNQVWVWDITYLPASPPHKWFYAYAVLDLYSRYVVAWLVSTVQSAAHAERLFAEACIVHDVAPEQLCVHSDRGSPMTSGRLADLFSRLGVTSSYNRPHVSNDNPHAESHFKTMKYQPEFPGRFRSEEHARQWLSNFFSWYNQEHKHESLALFTPANLFLGQVDEILKTRQGALDAAYAAHPERFVKGPPIAKRPPEFTEVNPIGFISPEEADALEALAPPSTMPIVRAPNNKGRPRNRQRSLFPN